MLNAINLVTNTPPAKPRSAPDSDPAGAAPDGFARAIAKARLAEREQSRQLQRAAEAGGKGPLEPAVGSADDRPSEQSVTQPTDATAKADRDGAAQDGPVSADLPAAVPAPAYTGRALAATDVTQDEAASPTADAADATGTVALVQAAMDLDPARAQGSGATFAQRGMAAAVSSNAAMQRVQAALDANPAAASAARKPLGPGDEGRTLPVAPDAAALAQGEDDTQGKALPGWMATVLAGNAAGGGEGQPAHTRDNTGRRAPVQGLTFERQEATKAGESQAARTDAKADETRAMSPLFAETFRDAQAQAGAGPNFAGAPVAPGTANTSAALPNPQAQATLGAHPGSEAFGAQASQQIAVFVRDGIHTARLNLNPAEMGPVTVQIQLDGLNAQVHLAAEQGLTRQALEQSMPMLASQLRESGLTLTGGGVFEQPRQTPQDGAQGQNGNNPRDSAQAGNARPPAAGDEARLGTPAVRGGPNQRTRGMVDLVA